MAGRKRTRFLKQALKCRSKEKRKVTINKTKDMSKKKFRVAVYGTLRHGGKFHENLENAVCLGIFQTEPIYKMFSKDNQYPYLLEGGGTSVTMEVYEFDSENIADRLDHIENFDKNNKNSLFDKKDINTPYGKAFVYIRKKKIGDNDARILSGDWNDFKHVRYTHA